jgi:hypothetical protein
VDIIIDNLTTITEIFNSKNVKLYQDHLICDNRSGILPALKDAILRPLR